MNPSNPTEEKSKSEKTPVLSLLYRFRFLLTAIALTTSFALFAGGLGAIGDFSKRVDSMKETQPENPQPKMFDTRTDIWFDPGDEGLAAYRDIEAQFIAEDAVIVAFEETKDPWGVFGEEPLQLLAQLTGEFEKIPYVRNVRSLTSSPWIRNGEVAPGEQGLLVSDLFDRPMKEFTKDERLERMIAVLGAEGASQLAGEGEVRRVLGADARFSDHQGEERFVDAIVSRDGRTAALQLQVIRERPEGAALLAAFPNKSAGDGDVASALHTIDAQSSAVGRVIEGLKKTSGRDIHMAGIPVIERHFPEVGQADMAFLGLMFLVIGAVLFAVYRKVSGVVLPLLTVFGSIFAMNGLVWLNGDLINNLTAMTPLIMTAVGVADAVHLVTAYFLLRRDFDKKDELIVAVLKKNALPVFLTSLTTVVAFLSLTVSPIVPIVELGYTAAIGTVAAYLLSMTMVPALLSLLPLKKVSAKEAEKLAKEADKPYWTDALASFVQRRRTGILLASVGVLALSAVGVGRLQVESDLRMMFPKSDWVLQDQNWIESKLGGAGDLDLVFYGAPAKQSLDEFEVLRVRAEELAIKKLSKEKLTQKELVELSSLEGRLRADARGRIASNGDFLEQVDRFERRLEEEAQKAGSPLRTLTSFDSGLSVLRRMHQVQNENRPSFYRVPSEKDVAKEARTARIARDPFTDEAEILPAQSASTLAAQYYLQYENGAKPAENLSPFVSADRRGFRIAARTAAQSSREMLLAYEKIRTIARDEFPQLTGSEEEVAAGNALSTMRLTGKNYLFMNMMERFTETLVNSLGLALLVITLVIGLVFRSLRLALVSMVPNVLPLVLPLAVFGLLGVSLDGPAVIVATIALGVCVDDTIHLLSKYSEARKKGQDTQAAIVSSFRQVGGALSWTSLTLVLGFAVVALSAFRPNMLVGVLGATMVALAWVADLVVTPALLSLIEPERATDAESPLVDVNSPQAAE